MGIVGKAKALAKKIGKANPKNILTKVGKVAEKGLGIAKNVLSKAEDIGNAIASVPVIGDLAKQAYSAPVIKGMSAQMLFEGAKLGVKTGDKLLRTGQSMINKMPSGNVEQIISGKMPRKFSNQSVANIGNKHLQSQRQNATMVNDIISSAGRHPVLQSRARNITKHLQSQDIMKATPLRQVSNVVKHHTTRVVNSSLG